MTPLVRARTGIAAVSPELAQVRSEGQGWWHGARCVQILEESGFLPAGAYGLVNLCSIPAGLNAEETESFLRENAAEICGRRQNEGKP